MNDIPSAEELAVAPVLTNWIFSMFTGHCQAVGIVDKHPVLGEDRKIHTSPILAIDENLGWIRTFSRLYVLGIPAAAESPQGEVAASYWPFTAIDPNQAHTLLARNAEWAQDDLVKAAKEIAKQKEVLDGIPE